MKKGFQLAPQEKLIERAYLVGVSLPDMPQAVESEHLEELQQLATTAGAIVVGKTIQSRTRIDGATFIDKILFVVFPILRPLLVINFVGVFIGAWYGAEGNILAMTGGGANTMVAGLHIFFEAFINMKFGPATAMAWILGLMLIGFTIYQLRILANLEFKTTGSAD